MKISESEWVFFPGYLQRERGKQTVLAEYSRDRLHRESNRLSGGLDQRTEYDSSGRITAQIARRANSSRVTAATIDKRYTWDKHNNLTERSVSYGQADSPLTQGHWQYETYRYDPLGQLTRRLNGFSEELFLYDEAANLLGHQRQVAFNNQVTTSEEYDYTYDGFGRMAQRRVRDSAECQHYHYDAEHRITAVTFAHDPQGNQRAEYDYDILGRRIAKRVWQSVQAQRLNQPPENREPEETVQFCWNGLRLAAEKSSKSAHLTLHYVYNSGSYNPLARIESFDHPEKQTTDIAYYHVALNGLPEELTDSQGRIIWHGDYSLWGKLRRETRPVPGFRGLQNLRFQGQYFDRETGLHYNTFRYYAPDTGRFTQQDPIGLMGGLNLYQYAPNPVGWVDPWGLSSFDPFIHGEITNFPKDLHFGQNRIAPNFSSIGSQADPLIAGRPILDVANDITAGRISPDAFVISYTIDPATGKYVTLNNRGLAAIIESGKYPQHAIYVPYENVPKHLVKDILDRPPSRSISMTKNKDGTGLNKIIGCKN